VEKNTKKTTLRIIVEETPLSESHPATDTLKELIGTCLNMPSPHKGAIFLLCFH